MKKKMVILGGGESGTGAAVLARDKGYEVFLSDTGMLALPYRELLEREGIEYEQGHAHTEARVLEADEVVKSPGIPDTAPLVVELRRRGVPVISEIELAGRYTGSKMVCITGSNGKTTTTTLLHHILKGAGFDCSPAGNVGRSLALQVAREPHDVYVVELSSFQLDGMEDFRADVAVLMNITPDHMDRYDHRMENYAASKLRIVRNQRAEDTFIYWDADPWTLRMMELYPTAAQKLAFGAERMEGAAAWLEGEVMHVKVPGKGEWSMGRGELSLRGLHNVYNSMAASLAAMALGVEPERIKEGLATFEAVEHRLEKVAEVDGVEYINDSKATNVASTYYALEAMTRPTVLILGGTDKGNDYGEILPLLREHVKHVVAMGVDNGKIVTFCAEHGIGCTSTGSLEECLAACREVARAGDTVLLSPCCASFDLFRSYVDRGNRFKAGVLAMAGK